MSTTNRKLAAILSADVAGYSRLMAEDEQATLATLTEYRVAMRALITKFRGRVVDAPGDALLAEFLSAVEAVQCAVEIQKDLLRRNTHLPESRRMLFRIGVNLGDVIEQDGALYGDGVNIAARLEALAEPGGVCVSGIVFDQVDGKVTVPFRFAGEQTVKNIAKPVRAYHVLAHGAAATPAPRKLPRFIIVLVAVAAILGVLVAAYVWRAVPGHEASAPDSLLTLPSSGGLAVLPFTNMSGDPGQDYLSDGLTEDIVTELARFKELRVLARNTTFQYKGQAVNVVEIGRKLGARYVLEGSVRKAGNRLRITAQLIDASDGSHLWAEKYDREATDILIVQDEIAGKIVAAVFGGVETVLTRASRAKLERAGSDGATAYDLALQARVLSNTWRKDSYRRAKGLLEKAIELDPSYPSARQQYAYLMLIGWITRIDPSPRPPPEVKDNAIKAVALDPSDHLARRTAAFGYFFDHQLDRFRSEARAAIELAPNDATVLAELGFLTAVSGEWERGIALVGKANALNPESAGGWYHAALFYDLFRQERYKEALEIIRLHPQQDNVENQQKYVAAYAEIGDLESARKYWQQCLELEPDMTISKLREVFVLWNFPPSFIERYFLGFSKAGIAS